MASVEELCDHIALIDKSEKILEGNVTDIRNTYKSNTFEVEFKSNRMPPVAIALPAESLYGNWATFRRR